MFSQLLLIGAILLLALTDPARSPLFVALGALLVAATSSTQDIVVDAFRVESLPESEQAAGMASYVAAYRIGMLVSTAGALFLVSAFEGTGIARASAWMWGYVAMAALVLIGTVTALAATEPEQSARAEAATAHRDRVRARDARRDRRVLRIPRRARDAWAALAFVVLYKFTDAFSGTMTAPFVIDLGFTRNDYAAIVKGVGLAATLIGGFAGGFVARRYSLAASLWIGGVLQAVANLSFSWLALCRRQSMGAGVRDHGGEFHQRHRHRDLRRLSVGAVPEIRCTPPPNTRCSPRSPRSGAPICRRARAMWRRRPAGRCSSRSASLVAVPSLILLAWLQRRGHFEGLGTGEGVALVVITRERGYPVSHALFVNETRATAYWVAGQAGR